MNYKIIVAIGRKDIIDIVRNKGILVPMLMPIFLAVIFTVLSIAISSQSTVLYIYDQGNSPLERILIQSFPNSQIVAATSPQAVVSAFGANGATISTKYALGLIIPNGFDAALADGKTQAIQIFFNGDDVNQQQSQLIIQAINAYSRAVAQPQSPVAISSVEVNPPHSSPLLDINKYYGTAALMSSFITAMALLSSLLIEEKEKKTLRMLMTTPASWWDIIAGKTIVGFVYQLIISIVVLGIMRNFSGQLAGTILFLLLGCLFSTALGILFGALFNSTAASGALTGIVSFAFILPTFAVGFFGQLVQTTPFYILAKILPTFYIADGLFNSLQGITTPASLLTDSAISIGAIIAGFAAAVFILRKQALIENAI